MTSHEIKMPPDKSLFDGIIFAHTLFHKMVFRELKDTGLTPGQPKILEFLADRGTVIQKYIAQACEIEPSTAARLLQKMEETGLICREKTQENRRSIFVSLTAQGQKTAAFVQEAFRKCEKTAFSQVDREQCKNFLTVLETIQENLCSRDAADEKYSYRQTSCHALLLTCQNLLRRRLFQKLSGTGLTSGQPKILEFLEKGEGCQQKEVAAACRIEPATVTSLLFYMEKAGLVSRQSKNGDRRSLYVYLTAKGRQMMEKTVEALEETVAEAFAGIEEKQQEFKEILQIIHKNLKSEEFYD